MKIDRATIRNRFSKGFPVDVSEAHREYDSIIAPWAWPGGYTITYLDAKNGDVLCAKCAKRYVIIDGGTVYADTYDEGPAMECDGCGAMIESSYGDPDNPENK